MINFAKGIFTNRSCVRTSGPMPLSPGIPYPVSKLNSRGGSASTALFPLRLHERECRGTHLWRICRRCRGGAAERSDNRFAYDLNDHSATKLEYDHHSQRGQKDFNTLAAQFSFAF